MEKSFSVTERYIKKTIKNTYNIPRSSFAMSTRFLRLRKASSRVNVSARALRTKERAEINEPKEVTAISRTDVLSANQMEIVR